MATVKRRITLVNPARRKRKLSPKQVAIFGTKRQKAALKASRSRKRRPSAKRHAPARKNPVRRTKSAAPRRTRRAAPRRRTKPRKNTGGIIEMALANPAPKRRNKVARRKRRTNSTSRRRRASTHRRRRSNPVMAAPRRHRRRRSSGVARKGRRRSIRRNPGSGGLGNLVTSAAYAIAGAVGSKLLTQAVLGSSNTGVMGYGGNLVAAFALGKGIGMFTRNKQAQNAVILGGVIQTVLRIAIDKTPFGSRLQNIGMGDYQVQNYLSPQTVIDGLHSAAINPPVMPAVAMPRGAMAGIGRGLLGGVRR